MSEHLYIHVPFCLKKCRYCDFYSETDQNRIPAYVSALVKEIQWYGGKKQQDIVNTVYFGGGTPSLLPTDALEKIFNTLHRCYSIPETAEITLEANPGTLDKAYLENIRAMGINRLSIGVQSFNSGNLSLLGRVHTGAQAADAVKFARAAGFDNIGLDLIFGLPGQSRRQWREEMDIALGSRPEHLSCYMLTLEPGTPLYSRYEAGRFLPMAQETQVDYFSFTSDYLSGAGYTHYEISNFASGTPKRSRHNSMYWQMRPYSGFGPSAHSYQCNGDMPKRSWNLADLGRYIDCLESGQLPVEDEEYITISRQLLEMVMVGLRTVEGIDLKLFDTLSEKPFTEVFAELINTLVDEGLGRHAGNRFSLTRAGWARLDSIVEEFAEKLI
ncbi:MAG: radical SAM family heme chaperone HemW [Desulfobacterales bacterium]|nr:radical SAM family heme chaperone HemW [Desulfobacterales bacterium]